MCRSVYMEARKSKPLRTKGSSDALAAAQAGERSRHRRGPMGHRGKAGTQNSTCDSYSDLGT